MLLWWHRGVTKAVGSPCWLVIDGGMLCMCLQESGAYSLATLFLAVSKDLVLVVDFQVGGFKVAESKV